MNYLIIPDIHCDIEWAQEILKVEKGNYDNVIYLGDFYDSLRQVPDVADTRDTAFFHKQCLNDPVSIVLLGNHDLPIFEHKVVGPIENVDLIRNPCSGFSLKKAEIANSILTLEDWGKSRIFVYANGYLISHAGFNNILWNDLLEPHCNLSILADMEQTALKNVPQSHPFFYCGATRGGRDRFSGPLWLDFNAEFSDIKDIKQIVGHTQDRSIRVKGNSVCLDCQQSAYAILNENGILQHKSLFDENITAKFFLYPINNERKFFSSGVPLVKRIS